MFVITREENQYDQYGKYFVAAFNERPTLTQLNCIFENNNELALHVRYGGGRRNLENMWYNLHEIKEGELLNE